MLTFAVTNHYPKDSLYFREFFILFLAIYIPILEHSNTDMIYVKTQFSTLYSMYIDSF